MRDRAGRITLTCARATVAPLNLHFSDIYQEAVRDRASPAAGMGTMPPKFSLVAIAALAGVAIVAALVGYLVGRASGKRAERRHWERIIASQTRELGRTRANIRRALQGSSDQSAKRPERPDA